MPAFAALAVLAAAAACAHAPDAEAQDTDARSRCGGDGGAFIPANLEEAIAEVLRDSKPEELERFKQHGPEVYHHGFGTSLRNCWGLWGGKSPLAKWFQARGIWHPDDMSGIVLKSLHRRLLGQPIDLEGQIAHTQAYWKKQREEYEKGTDSGRLNAPLVRLDDRVDWIYIHGDHIPFVNELYDAMRKHAEPALRACFGQFPGTPGGKGVDTIVRITLDGEGRIERARVQETALFDRDAECMASALVGTVSPQHKASRYLVTLNSYRSGKASAGPLRQMPEMKTAAEIIQLAIAVFAIVGLVFFFAEGWTFAVRLLLLVALALGLATLGLLHGGGAVLTGLAGLLLLAIADAAVVSTWRTRWRPLQEPVAETAIPRRVARRLARWLRELGKQGFQRSGSWRVTTRLLGRERSEYCLLLVGRDGTMAVALQAGVWPGVALRTGFSRLPDGSFVVSHDRRSATARLVRRHGKKVAQRAAPPVVLDDPASAWNSVHEQGIERGLAAGILRRVDETWVAYRALALPRLWFQDGPGVIGATGSDLGEPGGGPPVA